MMKKAILYMDNAQYERLSVHHLVQHIYHKILAKPDEEALQLRANISLNISRGIVDLKKIFFKE